MVPMSAQTVPGNRFGLVVGERQLPPLDDRGHTNVEAKVISKIAQQAAYEVPGIGSGAGGFLGLGSHREFDSSPDVDVELYGNTVVVRMDIGIGFPTNLGEALQRVRTHVAKRVQELTGFEVGHVDVKVSWLHTSVAKRREVL